MASIVTMLRGKRNGFTLIELLVVVTLLGIISSIALPAFSSYYEGCCVMSAVSELTGMIKEAKQNALSGSAYYALGFDPAAGRISLIADRGRDGHWNTADDRVVRSFRLADKRGGLSFGYGECGPRPGLGRCDDGVSFQSNNTLVCNPDLTGSAGTVYLRSRGGSAMAVTMNSRDFSYSLWRWDSKKWVKQ